jgi:hypothetical protein
MSTTARDLIKGSLKLIGIIASGENPSAEEANDALTILNEMLDNWSTESLFVFSKTIEDFALVPSQQVYTMGTAGDFNTSRPQKILHAATVDLTATPTFEIPLDILNFDQWSEVSQKGVTSTLATKLYVDYANPLVSLSFYPVPTIANNVRLYSWKPLAQLTLDTAVDLPPGYKMAIRYNLAVMLSPEYSRPVSQDLGSIAQSTKASIQRMNIEPVLMKCDPATLGESRAWDWRTGE